MAQGSSSWVGLAVTGLAIVGAVGVGAYLYKSAGPSSAPAPQAAGARVDDSPLACVFARGDEQTYKLKTSFDVTLDPSVLGLGAGAPGGGGIATGEDIEGTLQIHALHADGDTFVVAMHLADPHLTPRGFGGQVKADALAKPWVVKIGSDCSFRSVGYASDADPHAVRTIESLLQQVEVLLPARPRDARWRATQNDGLGTYLATYQRTPGHARAAHRARGTYTKMWPTARGTSMSGSEIAVVSSATDFTVDADGRWLDDLTSTEDLKISTLQHQLVSEIRLGTHLTAADPAPTGLADVSDQGMTWRPAGSPPVDVTEESSGVDAGALAALPLDAILDRMKADLASNAPGSVARASDLLRDVLRRNPTAASTLYDDLLSGRVDNALAPVAFLGLQKAGTREAQAALVRAMNEGRMTVPNRLRAVAALPQVPHPTVDTLVALETMSDSTSRARDEETVRSSATFAIGTLERATRDKDSVLSSRARDEIRAKMRSRDPDALTAALGAIGNTGDKDLLTDVKPHLADADVSVRRQAIEALGSMPPDSDADAFAPTFDAQSAPRLRGLTAQEFADQARLAGTPPPDAVVTAAIARLGKETDPTVRLQLVQLLGLAASSRSDVRAALSAQFGTETDPGVQSAIGEFVSGGDLP
jgi:hypothetical protein